MSIPSQHHPARAIAIRALLGSFLLAAHLLASTGKLYRYDVDLVNITRDKFKVTLHNEGFAADNLTYHFPKVIPGTYKVADYGKYIRRFRAWDHDGRRLKVRRRGWNTFRIRDARQLATISYWVNDTWDARFVRNDVYPMAGTNIDAKRNVVINAGGVFGYFEGEEQNPVEATFAKPEALHAMTVLPMLADNGREVIFRAENYHQLVDSPIMFAPADTVAFRVRNARVTISVDAATGSANHAEQYYSSMAPAMAAIGTFLDTLPVDDYAFLIYQSDQLALGRIAANPRFEVLRLLWYLLTNGLPVLGALEHNTSSFYYWLDAGPELRAAAAERISDAAIHEFMHILTPLTLHSQHVGNFNYADPVMSKHLWLYEGVTEYFAQLIPVRAGLKSPKEFILADIRGKIRRGERFPNEEMSFTEMSANIFHRPYKQQFGQVYQRGAAMGMLIDIEIIRMTDGEKTLISVLQELSRRYGASKSFDEDTFIEEFVASVHPDLQQFFDDYVSGREELPYDTILDHVGVEYVAEVEESRPRHPISDNDDVKRTLVGFGPARKIKRAKADNFAGLMVGDLVKSASYRDLYTDDYGNYVAEGTQIDFPVVRDGEEITLPITVEYKEATTNHKLRIREDMSPSQEKYYRIWLGLDPAPAQADP
ncbi:MAG: hypothetical protein V3U35_05605 [Candidatus Neomarinimicrobiota bacterium]